MPFLLTRKARPGKVVTASVVVGLSERAYDYLLVDARTGLTDVRGVTLIDMPDLVVAVTNLSRQSAEGIREQLAQIEALNSLIREQKSCLIERCINRITL
jgi:MinD-like ATPase involved in chromosome partitioning or flagellar assembly